MEMDEDEPPSLVDATEMGSEALSAIAAQMKGLELTKVPLSIITGIASMFAHRSSVIEKGF